MPNNKLGKNAKRNKRTGNTEKEQVRKMINKWLKRAGLLNRGFYHRCPGPGH